MRQLQPMTYGSYEDSGRDFEQVRSRGAARAALRGKRKAERGRRPAKKKGAASKDQGQQGQETEEEEVESAQDSKSQQPRKKQRAQEHLHSHSEGSMFEIRSNEPDIFHYQNGKKFVCPQKKLIYAI